MSTFLLNTIKGICLLNNFCVPLYQVYMSPEFSYSIRSRICAMFMTFLPFTLSEYTVPMTSLPHPTKSICLLYDFSVPLNTGYILSPWLSYHIKDMCNHYEFPSFHMKCSCHPHDIPTLIMSSYMLSPWIPYPYGIFSFVYLSLHTKDTSCLQDIPKNFNFNRLFAVSFSYFSTMKVLIHSTLFFQKQVTIHTP